MPHNKTPLEVEEKIIELLKNFHLRQQDIAEQMKVHKDVVARILSEQPEDFKKARYSGVCRLSKLGDKNPMKGKTRMQHHNAKVTTVCSGYLTEWAPDWWTGHKPKANRVFTHQRVWAETNNKTEVPKNHVIHHTDENKLNNDPSNLVCLSRKQHAQLHCISNLLKEQRLSRKGVEDSVLEAQSIQKDDDIVWPA